LRFSAPQGRHVAPMGVKFGTEEGPLLRAKFHPHRWDHKGVESLFTVLPSVDSIRGFAHAAGFAAARRCTVSSSLISDTRLVLLQILY